MPSQSPPLVRTPFRSPTRWVPPGDQPMPPVVNPKVVGSAVVVSFALISGIVSWIATHPNKVARNVAPLAAAVAAAEPEPRPVAFRPVRDDIVPAVLPTTGRAIRNDRATPPTPPQPQRVRITETAPTPPKAETYGTSVLFLGNPAQAAETALREGKLLFVLHVSGNFEDSCFT